MKNYCIPPNLAQNLLSAAKGGDPIGDIETLYGMTTDERRAAFGKHVGEDTAKLINTEFEKAMISTQQKALATWAKSTFTPEAKKNGHYKSAIDKINELSQQGLLTPENTDAFLEDLVSSRLGVSVSADEAKIISEKAAKIEELAKETSPIGLPTPDYFKAKSEMEKYLQSQMPSSNLKVTTSTIGRAAMLASFKSPIVNIESNTVQGILTAFERRLATGQYTGLNGDFARTYVRENYKIYQKSGYDLSRMTSFSDDQKILGEEITHSQGSGPVRAIGRVAEDIVFKQLMGAPDVAFSSVHFSDSANLASTKIATGEGLKGASAKARALEIFKDAVLLEPKTIEGELVRSQAITDAQYATYTNKSTYSDTALAIRGVFNKVSGDARVGDQIMPFVKTPANVVGAGIDYSGIALPSQIVLLPKAIAQAKQGDKVALQRSIRSIVRAGLGLTFAFALSNAFKPEDFIGNYPVSPKEQKLLDEKNATTNSVRIGDKWISLDYFGPLAAPFIGMMYAKKYAHDPVEDVIKYYQGVGVQALKIPGFQDFQDVVKNVQDFTNEAKTGKKELQTAATNLVLDYIRSRTVPAIVNDIAKASDGVERVTSVKDDPLARIKASIPGLRGSLPEKQTVFGDTKKSESAISTLLFGSRVKTASQDKLVKELVRLDEAGQLPAITDIDKRKKPSQLKEQIGDQQFAQALDYYKARFKTRVERVVDSRSYRNADDEKRKKMIETAKDKAVTNMLHKYHYRKPRP